MFSDFMGLHPFARVFLIPKKIEITTESKEPINTRVASRISFRNTFVSTPVETRDPRMTRLQNAPALKIHNHESVTHY